MIHLATHKNGGLYEWATRDFHLEWRRRFNVDRIWRLAEHDRRDLDDDGDDRALCLLSFCHDAGLEVGCGLRRTVEGGPLSDVLPHLIAGHEPSLQEGVRDRGSHRHIGFVDRPLLGHLRRYSGLRIGPVGLSATHGEDGVTVEFEIGVTTKDLQDTRCQRKIPARQLVEAPEWTPLGTPVIGLAEALAVLTQGEDDERAPFSEAACVAPERTVHFSDLDGLMTRPLARAV